MPKVTIDGKEIEVPQGTRVIEAAKMVNVDAPYYCYHPGLSVAGNCRMCLVEVEKMPKLQIACHMQVQDGMVVCTNSERVLKTRQHILEFLLVNHPLDCPVCDQAGECWLQDYYMKHGLYDSRVSENKVKKHKAVSLGPTVMLDAERCILCSRCVRFTDEISKTHELGIANRGDHCEIQTFPGKELNNDYSGNVVDICPVGALTDKDFRFKMRVWYLQAKDSICNGCSMGCNIQVHYNLDRPHHAKGERVMRLKPRYNEHVNQWWMCDEGRYGYKYHDHNRILAPLKRAQADVQEISWDELFTEAARDISAAGSKMAVFLSPQLSNEELYLARILFREKLECRNIFLVSPKADGKSDDFLMKADKNPNTRGAADIGFKVDPKRLEGFQEACEKGQIEGIIVFGQDLFERLNAGQMQQIMPRLKWSVFIGSNHNLMSESASYVMPSATYVEKEGTFTNCEGKVQKFNKVFNPLPHAWSEWKILINLAKYLDVYFDHEEVEDIFEEMTSQVAAFKNLKYDELDRGKSDIRSMAAPTIPALEQYDNIL